MPISHWLYAKSTTGRTVPITGIYRSDCPCKVQMELAKNSLFPDCNPCGKTTVSWGLVQETG